MTTNLTQANTTKKRKSNVNSLGALATRQEYDKLFQELKDLDLPENARLKEEFYTRKEDIYPSEMDKLLVVLISNMKPKVEEEDPNASASAAGHNPFSPSGTGTSSPMQIGGVNVGSPLAPPIGLNLGGQQAQESDPTFNEFLPEHINKDIDFIPSIALDCVDHLLANGVNPNANMQAGINAVLIAATLNNEQPLLRLLDNPYEARDFDWNLITQKGKIDTADVLGNDLLAYAVQTSAFYMADYLIDNLGFDINKKYFRMNNQTLLHIVAERFTYKATASSLQGMLYDLEKNSNEDKIVYLLEKGADPSILNMDGKVPEELIPFKSPELEEELGKISAEEEGAWDRCFLKLGTKRKEFEAVKKSTRKLSF